MAHGSFEIKSIDIGSQCFNNTNFQFVLVTPANDFNYTDDHSEA